MRSLALLPALSLLAMAPASAQMPENFVIDTAADLVAVCSVDPSSEEYVAALNFCEGYGHGAVQYHNIMAEAVPAFRLFCTPDPAPTREEVWADALNWITARPALLQGEALDAMFTYLSETFPCP